MFTTDDQILRCKCSGLNIPQFTAILLSRWESRKQFRSSCIITFSFFLQQNFWITVANLSWRTTIITIVSRIYTPLRVQAPPHFQPKFLHRYFYLAYRPPNHGHSTEIGSLPAMESPYATSYCPSYLTSSWVGPTLPLLTEVSFLLFFPLCLIVHRYYFPCHLSVFSLKFTIVLRHVLLLNLRSHPTRPYGKEGDFRTFF